MAYIVETAPSLLIHANQPIGSTDFFDSSGNDVGLTANGSVSYSTTQSKWSESIKFANTSANLTTDASTGLQLGTDDFTIDYWIYISYVDSSGPNHLYIPPVGGGSYLFAYQSGTSTAGRFYVYGPSGGTLGSTTYTVNYNAWNHIAIVRSSGTITLYINGYARSSKTDTSNYTGNVYRIGACTSYIDEFRVTKGMAIWTSNFTPPTQPYSVEDGPVWSVYFDLESTYGASAIGIRSIDFYKNNVLLDFSNRALYGGWPGTLDLAFNTSLSKTGPRYLNEFQAASSNQRLSIHTIYAPFDFDKIIINNAHNSGGDTYYGTNDILITTSSAGDSTLYANLHDTVPDAAVIFDGNLSEHVALDIEDPQVVYDVSPREIDVDIDAPSFELSGITENAATQPDREINADLEAVAPAISGVTVNSAPVPFIFLVQSEQPDGSKDFHDAAKNLPVYATGDVQHVTDPEYTTPHFGTSCIRLTSSYYGPSDGILYTEESDDFAFGTGDFTVDFWFYQIYPATNGQIFSFSGSPTGKNYPAINLERVSSSSSFWLTFSGMSSGPVGYRDMDTSKWWSSRWIWYHIAIDRREGVTRICRDGVPLYTVIDTTDYDARILNIGNNNCFIEELRVSRYSRWGGTFTPDTETYEEEDTSVSSFKPLCPSISAVVWNTPPAKTYVNGQPWLNQYNFNTNNPTSIGTFTQGTDFPVAISKRHSFVVDNYVYIIGGTTTYYAVRNSDGTVGTWNTTTGLALERTGGQLFQTYKRIYLAGGYESGEPVNKVLTALVNSDGTLGEWLPTYPMTSTRADFALAVTRNLVYALGGFVDAEIGGFVSQTYEFAPINYDGTLGEWQLAGNLLNARDRCFAVCTGDLLYLIGGGTLAAPLATESISVSSEGVLVGDWTVESWTATKDAAFVCSETRLFIIGGQSGNFSVDDINSLDIANGVIGSTKTHRGYLPAEVHGATVFLTDEKIHIIGGISTDVNDNWITVATTGVATFSGIDVDFSLYTSVEEETAIPIGGSFRAPSVELQSYFGYGAISYCDVVSPIPIVESVTRYTEFVDADISAPLPEIFSLGYHFRYINTEIVAPVPAVYGGSGTIISSDILTSVPLVYSYVLRVYYMTDIKPKMSVISASISNPIAINGNIKTVHPHFNSTFQSIVNIHAPVNVINGVTSNPYATFGNIVIKEPSISSLASNPNLMNVSIKPKTIRIVSSAFEVPYIIADINSKISNISSYVNDGPIRISGNFAPQHPVFHGEFEMNDDYSLIKYRENRLCRL